VALGNVPPDLTAYREKLQQAVDQLGEAATTALGGENNPTATGTGASEFVEDDASGKK